MNYLVLEKKSIFVDNTYNLQISLKPRDDIFRNQNINNRLKKFVYDNLFFIKNKGGGRLDNKVNLIIYLESAHLTKITETL